MHEDEEQSLAEIVIPEAPTKASPRGIYLIATPIGNLGDISLRALETMRNVDAIASEDTRKTGMLLKHYDIKKPLLSFHEQNELRAGEKIIQMVTGGQSVALVTDAGTPGVSDPGYTLVRRAIEAGVPVSMIPGPSAVIMALVLSGLAVHSFTFRGFPPRKGGPRRRFIGIDATMPHTLIYYESPYRLVAFLTDALAVLGDRRAAAAHDLTKYYESVIRGSISELIAHFQEHEPKGEYTVVVAGTDGRTSNPVTEREAEEETDDTE